MLDYTLDRESLEGVKYLIFPTKAIDDIANSRSYFIKYRMEALSNGNVLFIGENRNEDLYASVEIEFNKFKQIITEVVDEIISDDEEMRLENHIEIKKLVDELNVQLLVIMNERNPHSLFLHEDESELYYPDGFGFIVLKKSRERIATYESFHFIVNEAKAKRLKIDNIVASVNLNKYKPNELELVYYNPDLEKSYHVELKDLAFSDFSTLTFSGKFEVSSLSVGLFSKDHAEYSTIMEYLPDKKIIEGLDEKDPGNSDAFTLFKEKRLAIVNDYAIKVRQEEIFQDFADIEF